MASITRASGNDLMLPNIDTILEIWDLWDTFNKAIIIPGAAWMWNVRVLRGQELLLPASGPNFTGGNNEDVFSGMSTGPRAREQIIQETW